MTELPEDVARELDELFGATEVPVDAVSLQQLVSTSETSLTVWDRRMKKLVEDGEWARGKRPGNQAYWYWKIKDEAR